VVVMPMNPAAPVTRIFMVYCLEVKCDGLS
jgi:hypothetical protein